MRREGAGSRGGRVADEDDELEEGEARSDSDADGEDFVDPDVALSYIDEKLQHVLGHFQKEFEGGVSVENLGSKFGGYGSFLPTYQHSPLSQSISPHIAANISKPASPYQTSAKKMDHNTSTVAVEFIPRNNSSGAPSTSDLINHKKCSRTDNEESVAGSDSSDNSLNDSDSKSFKVRTKVCCNNDLPRENADIYSGRGLDISSSSSIEESPDGLGVLSPRFSNVPYESPRTILQVMTYFPVPGGFLLSPLHGNLLKLRNEVAPIVKNWETHLDMENVSRASEGCSQSFHPPGPVRGNVSKQMKPNTRKYKCDAIVNKEVNKEVPASQKEKIMNINNENGFDVGSARKEIPTSVKHGQLHIQSTTSVATMNADSVPAAVVMEDQWVCCDICQKCRLLPYGTNPSMLPKKWKCTMLHWLPGMNRCDISEDETTEALNALFAIPATATTFSSVGPHTAGADRGTSSAYYISGNFEQSRKRKNAPSDGQDLVESSYHTPLSTSFMRSQQDPSRNERTTGLGREDSQLCSDDKKDLDMEGPSLQPEQHPLDRRATTLNTESGPVKHESKNIEIRQGSGNVQRLGMPLKKEKSDLRIVNQDIWNPVAQVVKFPFFKESKQKVCPTSVKSNSLKMKAKIMRSNIENGVQHGTAKQAISSTLDTSPTRKDGSMVAFALKEARDLKHKANDLKNKGQELESTGLYFEAALKFLHVAFLLETPTFDISRPIDVTQSMKMYSETAKLCNFCAYEYERCKKMAAAALAYKCVEVAYLKTAYYKYPSASKDRQELQTAVKIARGESSSSSASNIDNLTSHGLSKASSSKGSSRSPHAPGNHLPLPFHNQAHLLRLLAYTNDVNLAFDATRKSELVIASAAGSQERGGVHDGLASVKTVLDLNFNHVNELLRLIRVSMESISS